VEVDDRVPVDVATGDATAGTWRHGTASVEGGSRETHRATGRGGMTMKTRLGSALRLYYHGE